MVELLFSGLQQTEVLEDGDGFSAKPTGHRAPLVELGIVRNDDAWRDFFKERGCRTPRDRRRAEHALCDALNRAKADDWFVIGLLNKLASQAPKSVIRDRILELTSIEPTGKIVPAGMLADLMSLKVDPRKYLSFYPYYWDNQLVKLLSKYPFKGYDGIAEDRAIELFRECERKNTLTNQRWLTIGFDPRIEAVAVRLNEILGEPPTIEEVIQSGGWGPGVMEGYPLPSDWTGPEFKFAVKPTITPSLIPIATRILEGVPAWDASLRGVYGRHERFEVVEGSTLFTVPKKFAMNRCALKEPAINAWMQSGLGTIMRKRFKQTSQVDLRFSWTVNQELARIGSLTGHFCTVDLSSASDTVCRGPLKSISHRGWFGLWEAFASPSCKLPITVPGGEKVFIPHKFQMMSSMGNGFTFELESILFYAIVTSVVPGVWSGPSKGQKRLTWPHVSVFGDDLVFPSAYYGLVQDLLTEFGFTVNPDKSFSGGPFRESCGKDYFNGVDTRPLYVTKALQNGSSLVNLANRIYAIAHTTSAGRDRCSDRAHDRWAAAWRMVVTKIPARLREVISTPPHVPSGLWGIGYLGEHTWESPFGKPDRWKVISQVPTKVDLRLWVLKHSEGAIHAGSSEVLQRLNCDNLMAARLSQSSYQEDKIERFLQANMSAHGEWAAPRASMTHKVLFETIVEQSRWAGF